jgi:hypothetical protein
LTLDVERHRDSSDYGERNRVVHLLRRDFLAVDLQRARASLTDAGMATTPSYQRQVRRTPEIEFELVLAGRQFRTFQRTLEIEDVPDEHRLALTR